MRLAGESSPASAPQSPQLEPYPAAQAVTALHYSESLIHNGHAFGLCLSNATQVDRNSKAEFFLSVSGAEYEESILAFSL